MATNDDAEVCPLCLETLDITDLACQFCTCGYSMCLWCWHRIREDAAKQSLPARCPNCRTVYQQDRVKMESIDANLLEDTRRRKKEDRKRTAVSQPKTRRDLANVRVVQRNLVYAVGLAMEICYEDTLMGPEYFGAFGKMVKQMSVNRMGPYGSSVSRNGPTGSAYITFKRPEDAKRCIEAVNGAVWGGKQVKACFGTTKYCNAFLKGVICNNPECLYLHDIAEDTDSYTKEETKSTKFINLTHAASMTRQPSQSPLTGTPPPPPPPPGQGRLQGATSGTLPRQFSFSQMSEASSGLPQTSDGWDSAAPSWLGSPSTATSWLAKAASSHALPTTPPMPSAAPVPSSADEQEWPELGGSTSNMAQQAASLAQERPAAPSSSASQPVHANGKASSSAETSPTAGQPDSSRTTHKPAASESANKSAAAASSSSPEQRLPATPTRASPLLHSPETPVSGQTTASGSPAGASQAAGHQQQQQQAPSHHSSQQATPSFPSNGPLGTDKRQQAGTQLQAQSQGRPAVSHAVQRDPVVQLVSRRSSGRVPPPGFSGPVAAPSTTSESASHAARHKGPPPGFGPAAQPSNGNAPPGFPSHSGSDSSDHSWSVSQAAPQQWASFHPSHSSPNAAGSDHSTHGLHQSHSAGLAGYPCQPFAMPGLSDLQNLREQSGSEHSLFSGSSNQPGLSQSQFRQRSRFQFAQDPPMGPGSLADGPTSPSMYSSLMSPAVQQKDDQHDQNNAQLQHDRQRHQSGHQLFPPPGPGFASASLFASSPGGASALSHQPGMHSVASRPGDGFVHAAACVMDHSGSNGHEVAPGQALLRQLQMSSALSSPQHAHHHQMWPEQSSAAAPGSGWDAYPAHSTSPFFDPAIVNASSAALHETGSAAAPVQMLLPPTLSPSQTTAASAPQAAHGQAQASEAGNTDSDASAPTPGLQTPPKNGKRRRGGRGTKSGAAHRSPQTRGRGRGASAGQPSNADLALLQQQYDQAKSQLAISGAQLAQAQEKFQNIHI